MELEKRVAEIHQLAQAIPTLDPSKGFTKDESRADTYIAREVNKTRTKKTPKVLVRYEATKEHPAQTEVVNEDISVGTIREMEWSSLITPKEKSIILDRVEILGRAVRRARSRANEQEVDQSLKIGSTLTEFVFGEVK